MIKNRLRNRKTDSKLEELLYKALLNEGLTPVLQQDIYWRGNLLTTLDLSFPEQKLAILADGHHWHSKPRDYIKDRVQDRRLQYLGWKVLRYPGQSIRNHLMKCIREIVEVLENSAHSNCTEV
jgi:very-short-patch-repair endonuclease